MTKQIVEKIKEYNKIIITRHIRPDGDCIGASLGLREIIKESFPNKEVKVLVKDYSESLLFIDREDEEQEEEYYKDSLIIIVDTASKDRISNDYYMKGKEIIKIDHHPNEDSYGIINYVVDELSSVCELIVKMVEESDELKLNQKASQLLYMGMVTDSGRFKYSTDGDTLRRAGKLLDSQINLEKLYANLYLKDFNMFKLQGEVYKKMKITKNGVAYVYITREMQEKLGLTPNEASLAVSYLDGIKGSLIWVCLIDSSDGTIRVRLRSRFITINDIASKYNGGGHTRASGGTLFAKEEIKKLIKDCDQKLKKYKEENTEWL